MTSLIAAYTSERKQFDRVIASFQAVSHRAADCFIDLECLRLVNQQAAINLNSNLDCENDALVAKIWASNACLLYTSPSPRDRSLSRMPSSA